MNGKTTTEFSCPGLSHGILYKPEDTGLLYVDHMVGNVGWGEMNIWCEFYCEGHGIQATGLVRRQRHLHRIHRPDEQSDEQRQRVYQVPDQRTGHGKEEIADRGVHRLLPGAGLQHVAMATKNILKTVAALRRRGVEFLTVPDTYYETVPDRVGPIEEDLEDAEGR